MNSGKEWTHLKKNNGLVNVDEEITQNAEKINIIFRQYRMKRLAYQIGLLER